MTGEKRMFSSYEKNEDSQIAITFRDGNQGLVKGLGKITISSDHSISNVFLIDSLDYNLLSISQLCKMGYNYVFIDVYGLALASSTCPCWDEESTQASKGRTHFRTNKCSF
jgi:hypothetical protein